MPFRSAKTKGEDSSSRTSEAALDDNEKASQGADLLLSLAETAREHAHISSENEKCDIAVVPSGNATMNANQSSHASCKTPVQSSALTSTEKEIQSGEPSTESIRSHLRHAYGWQRPFYYHPYGGMHLPYPAPHYPMPVSTEEVPASPLRTEKRVVLESIENPFSKDAKRPRMEGEERRQESPTAQSPRSTTDYKDDDEAEKGAKRESVISPSSSNETQPVTDTDSQQETAQNRQTSRPSTPGLTSDQSRQYPGYHGVHPQYMGYPPPPGFAAAHPYGHHYGAHPSIAYPFCASPPFYYRGGMMQSPPSSYQPANAGSQAVSPTPPRSRDSLENESTTAMKGLVFVARSDLLNSFPANDSFPNCNRCIPLKQPLPGRRWS